MNGPLHTHAQVTKELAQLQRRIADARGKSEQFGDGRDLTPEEKKFLRDNPYTFMPTELKIQDQRTGELGDYDLDAVCPPLQHGIVGFYDDTPRDSQGFTKYGLVVGTRQCAKTSTSATCTSWQIQYGQGNYGMTIADTKDRAKVVFRHATTAHREQAKRFRIPTANTTEKHQQTWDDGGLYAVYSAQAGIPGIGRSIDAFHWSEVPFCPDAGGIWSALVHAVVNRRNVKVMFESTPAPMDQPSAEWFRDLATEARKDPDRWEYFFAPFYTSLLNERDWNPEWTLTPEEERLLATFGHPDAQGDPKHPLLQQAKVWKWLTLRNLAYRRHLLKIDPEIRHNPEKFFVYCPVDEYSCWQVVGGSSIPPRYIQRQRAFPLVDWDPNERGYMEYSQPRPGAVYLLGVDPAGWGHGDESSFTVLEVWADRIQQVATFASNKFDPEQVANLIVEVARKYNDAFVSGENQGVGMATMVLLHQHFLAGRLKNLLYSGTRVSLNNRPGFAATSNNIKQGLSLLVDALGGRMELRDRELVHQLASYKNDKLIEEGDTTKILQTVTGKKSRNRRERHHWDRVSALQWACFALPLMPVRIESIIAPTIQEISDYGKVDTARNGLSIEQTNLLRLAQQTQRPSAPTNLWTIGSAPRKKSR